MATEQELKNISPLHKEFQSLLDEDFKDRKVKEGEIIKATVTEITPKFIVADAKLKMEAMIPIEEFKKFDELSKLKIGSTIDVFLDRIESGRGEIIISRDKARKMRAWTRMIAAFEAQEEISAIIETKIKGGYIADCSGLPCFLPSSQVALRPLKSIDHLMGTPIKVLCVRLDKTRGNAAVSRRAVLEKSKNAEVSEALKNIKEGDIVEDAIVKATTDWGIFLDINGIDALLHVSDLSHGRVKKPSDLVTIGQKLKIKITKIDPKTNRVSASVKALTEDPYSNIEKKYKINGIYEGIVTKIMDYGCFVRIEDGIEGLIHNSELDWTNRNIKPSKVLSVSENIKFKIVNIDKESKRISLSYKAILENPWDQIRNKVGKEVKIKISNVTDKSLFGELTESGLSGMLHWKEISWNQNIEDLKKFKKGDVINVKILEIKDDKIRFSKRALDIDPMDWFKVNKKKVGDIITTRVHEVLKTGVKVSIDKEKKLIVTIRKADLAIEPADCRPEIYSVGNVMSDAKIDGLDLKDRKIKLSVKSAMLDSEKSLIKKFGAGATKSGITLKSIFDKALGNKNKKKEEK